MTNVSVTPNLVNSIYLTGLTYTLEDGLLGGGLLGGILSGSASLRVQVFTAVGSDAVPSVTVWRSTGMPTTPITVTYSGGLLSGNFTCP